MGTSTPSSRTVEKHNAHWWPVIHQGQLTELFSELSPSSSQNVFSLQFVLQIILVNEDSTLRRSSLKD